MRLREPIFIIEGAGILTSGILFPQCQDCIHHSRDSMLPAYPLMMPMRLGMSVLVSFHGIIPRCIFPVMSLTGSNPILDFSH